MASPCRKCGATKTDPVHHGILYKLATAFGYRLHRCASCRTLRLFARNHSKLRNASQLRKEPAIVPGLAQAKGALAMAEQSPAPNLSQDSAGDSSDRAPRGCPECGSTQYHRTKRTPLERLQFRPPMASCENCEARFPYPGARRKFPEPLKSAVVAEAPSGSAEEKKAPKMAEGETQATATEPVAAANASDRFSKGPIRGPATEARSAHQRPAWSGST